MTRDITIEELETLAWYYADKDGKVAQAYRNEMNKFKEHE